MAKETKEIITPSFMAAIYEVEQLTREGWTVSTKEAPYQGFQYFVTMERGVENTKRDTLSVKAPKK